jgi:glycine/D-amino acid oxidase-like deaminating enzyme
MGDREHDCIIIGQGLAGTTLAWQLHHRGVNVLLVDRQTGSSASRIAAGLITPVTGKRMARSWRLDEVYPAAVEFYQRMETRLGEPLFLSRQSVRLFLDSAERDEFERRSTHMLAGLVRKPNPLPNPEWFAAPHGGFEMPTAARLDVSRYLDASRRFFDKAGGYLTAEVDLAADVRVLADRVELPRLERSCRTLIICRGFDTASDPWFGTVRFNAAKGEILTLRIPGLEEARVIHRGIWLAPSGGDIFRAGSTYVWDDLEPRPTREGRARIEERLKQFLRLPYDVLDHQAAVRPVIDAGYPVLGLHPAYPRIGYFNGLGSKGSLLAPFFADRLASCLVDGSEIERMVDVSKYLDRPK